MLRTNASIERFDLDGNTLADHLSKFLGPVALFESDGQAFDLAVGLVDDWSLFEVWQPLRGPQHDRWGLELAVEQVEVGDLDGDGFDELLLRGAVGQLGILRRAPFMQPDCIEWIPPTFPSPPVEVAVGDHDGDGDDEFAVRLDSGEVVLLDAE